MTQSFAGGRYVVTRTLGAGGMGSVYEVRVTATGGRAALKTLHASLATHGDQVERFRREATVMGALEHPHLARCFDFGRDPDGTVYLVMELLEGRSLHGIVAAEGPLAAERAVRLGLHVCTALSAAHAAGVVHRDIKPSNVMVVRGYDGREMAKVIDFGIASVKETPTYQRLTMTGQILGTPSFMAPEQLSGSEVGPRTDVYAVGALLYSVLAGRPPYPGRTLDELLPAVLAGDRPPLRVLRPDVGPLAFVVDRAMAAKADERFATMDELAEALRRYEGGVTAAMARAPVASEPRAADGHGAPAGDDEDDERSTRAKTTRARPVRSPATPATEATVAAAVADRDGDHARRSSRMPMVIGALALAAVAAGAVLAIGLGLAGSPPGPTPIVVDAGAVGARRVSVVSPTTTAPDAASHRVIDAGTPPGLTSPVPTEAHDAGPGRARPSGTGRDAPAHTSDSLEATVDVTVTSGGGDPMLPRRIATANHGAFVRCLREHASEIDLPLSCTGSLRVENAAGTSSISFDVDGSQTQARRSCLETLFYSPGGRQLEGSFSGGIRIRVVRQ